MQSPFPTCTNHVKRRCPPSLPPRSFLNKIEPRLSRVHHSRLDAGKLDVWKKFLSSYRPIIKFLLLPDSRLIRRGTSATCRSGRGAEIPIKEVMEVPRVEATTSDNERAPKQAATWKLFTSHAFLVHACQRPLIGRSFPSTCTYNSDKEYISKPKDSRYIYISPRSLVTFVISIMVASIDPR